jgi:hypothetical protein
VEYELGSLAAAPVRLALLQRTTASLAGFSAEEFTVEYDLISAPTGKILRVRERSLVIATNGRILTVTFLCGLSECEARAPDFEAFLASFNVV